MKKIIRFLPLCATVPLVSALNFYVSNLIFSDIANLYGGLRDITFLSSLPALMFLADAICFVLFLVERLKRNEQPEKDTLILLRILTVNSAFGAVFSLLTGFFVYSSFLAPYPFPGYTLISLCLHTLLFGFSIVFLRRFTRAVARPGLYGAKYVLLWALFYLASYDLGAVLLRSLYARMDLIALTAVFYVSLMTPMAIFAHEVYCILTPAFRRRRKIIARSVIGGGGALLSLAVIFIGSRHTEFISAISPALPLERLASLPLHTILVFTVSLIYPFTAFLGRKNSK